jgi:pyridoxal phosphate enzyme (YggS family)
MIHSVDTLDLLKEIDRQAKKHGRVIDVLIEVNVSGEESKSGIRPSEVFCFMENASQFENIKVRGLMTMAPLGALEDEIRNVFSGLSKISIDISEKKYDNISMDYLSMGMSNDFPIAIEEGSNIVRIGTALFK